MAGQRDGRWLRERLVAAHLYVCTGLREDLAEFLDAVMGAGVDLIQLRDKHADESALRAGAAVFRAAADRHGGLFILNDDPWLTAEVGADGVHVGQDDPAPAVARHAVGDERLIGRSTHSVAQVDQAMSEDCDYFAVGPVEATPTKEGRSGTGLGPVRHAAAVADRPWYVTGGMRAETAPAALAAGAHGIVVVRAITQARDPAAAAAELAGLMRTGARA